MGHIGVPVARFAYSSVVAEGAREIGAVDEAERLAWLVLQTVNRTQARSTTVRIIVPRDSEVADELGREL